MRISKSPMMKSPAIEIKGLKVRHGRRLVLDVNEISVNDGEFVAIMGRNGSGKTTLLKILLGLHKKHQGTLRVLGRNLDELNKNQLIRLRSEIGYVPQILPSRTQMPITAREVVATGRAAKAGLLKSLTHEDDIIINKWMEEFGLLSVADHPFNTLSGGEQRKVMIARAMVHEPRLLLLDEPTANLDLGWRERIVDTLHMLHEKTRITILLVAHELEVIPSCCSKVFFIDTGKIVAVGKMDEVFTKERIAFLYGVTGRAINHGNRFYMLPD